jgi:hypothetical protein
MPIQPDFSIEARIPDEVESRRGVADWCDLIITVEPEDGARHQIQMTRTAGELLIRTVGEVLHPWAGKSIIEHIWDELDDVMDGLMDGSDAGDAARGSALGLASALATMYNPIAPNVDAVREQAVDRWTERHADDEERALDEADLEAEDADEEVPFG